MDTRGAVERYYRLANAGLWDAWCELFAEDVLVEEQLAGRVRGRERLRALMNGFPEQYSGFANLPRRILVDGDEAAVLSHISARTAAGARIEAQVCNYFRFEDGLIAHFVNVHDTVPFQALPFRTVPCQTPPSPAEPRWSHVGLNCADQARTERFYTDWFGFRRVRADGEGANRIVFLRNGAARLELFPAAGSPARALDDGPTAPGTVRHLAFDVGDLDAFLRRLDGAAEVTRGPLNFGHLVPGWRAAWIADPDGTVIEVSQHYADQESQ